MPKSALPDHIDDPDEIERAFPDDRQYGDGFFGRIYTRFKKATKTWTAFGPRCHEWWARWRAVPKVLFYRSGRGPARMEDQGWGRYLSRIQYWTRWHVQLQWPFCFAFHIYWRAKDVPRSPSKAAAMTIKKMLYVYIGAHYDADAVYWFPSGYIGGKWK